jgi:hypothetical protein
MPEGSRDLSAFLSISVAIGGFAPYVWGVCKGEVRPQFVGWLIWTLLTSVVFLAQLPSGGGQGNWATAVISLLCLVALVLSWLCGDKSWNAFDAFCMGLALASVPLWLACGRRPIPSSC